MVARSWGETGRKMAVTIRVARRYPGDRTLQYLDCSESTPVIKAHKTKHMHINTHTSTGGTDEV